MEIDLIRLHDGRLPEPQIWVTDEPINTTLLDNVSEGPSLSELPALSSRGVDEQLATWARLLREVAPEVPHGDDAPIANAEAVVRQRAAEHPQEPGVWLPHDASDERERQAWRTRSATHRRESQFHVRRYHR